MTAVEHDSPRDDSTRKTAHFHHGGDDDPLSVAVVEAVAGLSDADPAELEPLYDRIDPDALDALFDSSGEDAGRDDGHVRFPFAGCEVTVYGDGFTVVRRLE